MNDSFCKFTKYSAPELSCCIKSHEHGRWVNDSDVELQPGEYAARHCGTVDVAGITLVTFVEIALVAVEYVLHAGVDLNRRVINQLEIVGNL